MSDAFQILGISPRLVISDEEVQEAFREAGRHAHPDAGGPQGGFSELGQALATLSSPSRRLKLWLELRGASADSRGTIAGGLVALFAKVGAVTQRAETVIRKRDEAKSALARALLEGEAQVTREAVESAIFDVDRMISRECETFPKLEREGVRDPEAVSQTARNLAFLEKWRAGLRACYSRLI